MLPTSYRSGYLGWVTLLYMGMGANSQPRNLTSEAFAATLRAERAARGLTQRDVWTRAGIPSSTYHRLESGERVMNTAQLGDITRALGMTLTDFVTRAAARESDLRREAAQSDPAEDTRREA